MTTTPENQPDAVPTASLELPDQQPVPDAPPAVASTPAAAAPTRSHTRTILEVVGAVVAVCLVGLAGVLGFVAGYVVKDHKDSRTVLNVGRDGNRPGGDGFGWSMPMRPDQQDQQRGQGLGQDWQGGPGFGQDQQRGQGLGQGRQGGPGFGWRDGQSGTSPTAPDTPAVPEGGTSSSGTAS